MRCVNRDREDVPILWCAACASCHWWTGWVCRQEAVGFCECPEYGVAFRHLVVAKDRKTGKGRYLTLKKGQLIEDLYEKPRDAQLKPNGAPKGLQSASTRALYEGRTERNGAAGEERFRVVPGGTREASKTSAAQTGIRLFDF